MADVRGSHPTLMNIASSKFSFLVLTSKNLIVIVLAFSSDKVTYEIKKNSSISPEHFYLVSEYTIVILKRRVKS